MAARKPKAEGVNQKSGNDKRNSQSVNPKVGAWPADRVKRRSVEELFPYARNARLHTNAQVDQIAESIRTFGFTVPVIVDHKGEIIAGHGRVMAARRLGLTEVPAVAISEGEWSEEQKRAYRIWDNQSALLSEWSPEMLKVELSALKLAEFPLQLTGFDDKDLVSYMAGVNARPPEQFPEVGDGIATEHSCPKCGYRWSGNPDAAARPEAAE